MTNSLSTRAARLLEIQQRIERMAHRSKMGYSERFEHDAEKFYRETGLMAPGKSVPLEMGSTQDQDGREAAWLQWCERLRTDSISTLTEASALLAELTAAEERIKELEQALDSVQRAEQTYNRWLELRQRAEAAEAKVEALTAERDRLKDDIRALSM